MIDIPIDQVPLIETKDILAGEMVAFGIVQNGVIVHYLERDLARIIEWEDIVLVGIGERKPDTSPDISDVREIKEPEVL